MKVKTMVDIYASAKRCTLEDIDNRNGRTSILSYTNQVLAGKSQMSKKRKVSSFGIGPVYIDAKGQKLRNLSEFSEKKKTSTRLSREQHQRGFSGEGSRKGHRRIYNQRMLAKCSVISKKTSEKGDKFYALLDQSSENNDELSNPSANGESSEENVLDKTDDMIYRQAAICKEDARFDCKVGKGSLFVLVDTIPIQGPSRSFIPSSLDIGFDENVGNSSVITTQVQSSIYQLDRNSSESPVSNFAASRLNFPAELASSSFAMNLTKSPTHLDPNHPFDESPYMIQQDMDLQSKFSSRTNLNGTVSSSPSNSVLRLMGKDLVVMNHGEAGEGAYLSCLT